MSARNEAQEPEVIIYTDGACKGNPGRAVGGADDLGDHRRELHGGETMTTNNRMELTAAIEALRALKRHCRVRLFTDSNYVKQGIETMAGNATAGVPPTKNR
jgi:ribonuclease HI